MSKTEKKKFGLTTRIFISLILAQSQVFSCTILCRLGRFEMTLLSMEYST